MIQRNTVNKQKANLMVVKHHVGLSVLSDDGVHPQLLHEEHLVAQTST